MSNPPPPTPSTTEYLNQQKPYTIHQPLHNSIPPNLLPRFDPIYVSHYNLHNAGRLHTHEVPISDYRANPLKYTISYGRATGPDVYRISEQKCPVEGGEIVVRIFEPEPKLVDVGGGEMKKKRGAYINFHGGGWVFGGLMVDHDFCKRIVHELDGEVVAFDVDYRLAPEYKYPLPVDDCWRAFNWILTTKASELNLDPNRVAVGGCSAGGCISAVIAHLCRDQQIPLRFQLLGVPVCDLHSMFTPEGEFDRESCPYESYREMEFTPALPAERMAYFCRHYLGVPRPRGSENDFKISPILAPNFSNLAPALIITAEMDPLRDEGEAYGRKMNEAAEAPVAEIVRVPGVPHVFMQLDGILEGGRLYNEMAIAALRKALAE
ncbi:MAG: hypothetical protein M1834_005985 [Cirrosporium novae-zelandiae]|nr:MAG: hypothetical protein M1834_005985 [Cirrosporium novae-zelandiae]